MRAGLGLSIAAAIAALAAGAGSAQSTTAPATAPAPQQSPPPDSVGPRELRDFSIGGTPARPAETPAAQEPAATTPAPETPSAQVPATVQRGPAPGGTTQERARAAATRPPTQQPSESVETAPPAPPGPLDSSFIPEPVTMPETASPAQAGEGPAEEHSLLLWPWLLAGLAVALGAGFLFLRQRARPTYAGIGAGESFVPAQPEPQRPSQPLQRSAAPAPAAAPPPFRPGPGIVSTRLRPWIELEFKPSRCILTEVQATVEFLITITNSGTAAARDLIVETMLFNAGPTQDEEIGGFFAHPFGRGEPIPSLPPLKSIEIPSSVSLPVERLTILQAADRQLFVPLIGFNALYRWGSNGQGQTSRSYLLGREGKGEKMSPFRADLGPRVFRGLGARELGLKVRR